jgi:hypothetical protein
VARQLPPECQGNSSDAQRARLLHRLRQGPITTTDARHDLDILHPPGRVKELRRAGFVIDMWRVPGYNSNGKPHNVGLYTLVQEPPSATVDGSF